ncbi:hypothetical protein M0Q97_02255 [Candidatus Dojkabacteria bacterium]|jgi:hypothetical protein|nr:hypothetical protein [Candidatus Dojkabacteria bacterium]
MKICIIGHAQHGKDTCAEILKKVFGMKFEASSIVCARLFIFDKLKNKYGYNTIEECWIDRVNHRAEWFDLICDYGKDDKAIVTKEILKNNDCYVGIRALEEFKASENFFNLIIWVDASKRKPLEPKSSMELTSDMADIIIENNGTLIEFEYKVMRLGYFANLSFNH